MDEFEVHVTDVTQPEFLQAARQLGLRYYISLVILIVIVTVAITLFTGQVSALSLGFPLAVLVVAPMAYELLSKKNYQKMSNHDLDMTYRIDGAGWRVTVGEETAVYAWPATHRVRETRDAFLLYNTKTTSSLLPKRLLTPAQQSFVREKGKK